MTIRSLVTLLCGVISLLGKGEAAAGLTWTLLDYPGASETKAHGISGGNIVGECHDANGIHGFLFNGTNWTRLDYPGAYVTWAYGIDGNNIVGYSYDVLIGIGGHTFFYNGTDWTTPSYPGVGQTNPYDLDGNDMVGGWVTFPYGGQFGFLYDGTNWTTLSYPGSFYTVAFGISGSNIVGSWGTGQVDHGFVYDGDNWTTLDFPGAGGTWIRGIDGTHIVGSYLTADHAWRGCIYDGMTWTALTVPPPFENAEVYPRNISGNRIVGYLDVGVFGIHGFLLAFPKLTLSVVNGQWGQVDVEPNVPFFVDSNTPVTLTATPTAGRSFGEWMIWADPNRYPDANFAVTDDNSVLHLTMDRDYQVEARFKCGSGLGSMLPLSVLGLAGAFCLRRRP